MSSPALPLIDVSMLRSTDAAQRAVAVEAIGAAARMHGFFYVCNHGVAPELQQEVFTRAQAFFAQPLEHKLEADKARSPCNRGYEKLGGQTLDADSPPDLKEGFYIGAELPPTHPNVVARRFNQGPNQWPAGVPGFRDTMSRYYDAMMELSAVLMGGVAAAMLLPGEELSNYMRDAMGTLRLLHYPPQPANTAPGAKGCGAHTDFGGITLLMQDANGGLQVLDNESGGWLDASPIAGTYVVNLGDLIARWTNGRFHSNMHRVINRSGRDRYSVPFFFSGNPDHVVRCLPWCLDEVGAGGFVPVTVERHLAECYRRTYG
jgi:isopenicillin N synthase-like dioxygenase